MPRIKFSTLVSAMAGKSNGSVFAKNNGGYYFRNNKSGYKLKSNAQSLAQGKFKSVSGQWRNLTHEQKEAWSNATVNYPKLDIFGDSRPRTGYDLYCQLNGALQLRNLPMISSPSIPNTLPSVFTSEWFTRPENLYQPICGLSNANFPSDFDNLKMSAVIDTSPLSVSSQYQVMIAFDMLSMDLSLQSDTFELGFLMSDASESDYLELYGIHGDSTHFGVQLDLQVNSYNVTAEFYLPKSFFKESNVFILSYQNLNPDRFFISINGNEVQPSSSTISNTESPFAITNVNLSIIRPYDLTSYVVKDFRVLYGYALPSQVVSAYKGYQTVYDALMFQFPTFRGDVIRGYVGNQEDMTIAVYFYGHTVDVASVTQNLKTFRFPDVLADFDISGLSPWSLELLTSPPMSAGRNARSTSYKPVVVSSVVWSGIQEISEFVQTTLGYISGNSTINLMYRFFDSSTGVVTKPQLVEKKKPSRFKAGAELSGKVSK